MKTLTRRDARILTRLTNDDNFMRRARALAAEHGPEAVAEDVARRLRLRKFVALGAVELATGQY